MLHVLTGTYHVVDPRYGRESGPIELDLGCGKGRFLLQLAERYPDRLVLGSDIMLGRLRRLARKVQRRGLNNVELLRAHNLELVGYQLPDSCIRRAHLLCPDPWPKARHRGKRLLTTDFLTRLARVLEPGGVFHMATDHAPYLEVLRNLLAALPFYRCSEQACEDVQDLKTDFELLWEAEGRTVPHLCFVRAREPVGL